MFNYHDWSETLLWNKVWRGTGNSNTGGKGKRETVEERERIGGVESGKKVFIKVGVGENDLNSVSEGTKRLSLLKSDQINVQVRPAGMARKTGLVAKTKVTILLQKVLRKTSQMDEVQWPEKVPRKSLTAKKSASRTITKETIVKEEREFFVNDN